jgi:gliding motility-associated-like protein
VLGTDANGCSNVDSVSVFVNTLPNIDAGQNTVICPGDSVMLNATGGIVYVWSPATGLSNPNIPNPSASPSVITTYTVIGTDANGCSNQDSVTVSIGVKPSSDFVYSLSLACEGIAVQFRDSSQNAFYWQWNFGDGNSSSEQNPVHIFPYGGNYTITLTAINPPCKDTAQRTITVAQLAEYITINTSNVFTPNGDGVNDCFRIFIRSTDIFSLGELPAKFAGCAELTIYDRWGVPVYHSEYSGACWDGRTSAGIMVSEGTYFYIFDLNGIQAKGFLTVLR